MSIEKICSKCHKIKPLDEFHSDKSRKDGRYPQCKECRSEHSKISYQEYCEELRKKRRDYGREHREKNKDKEAKRNKKYYETVLREKNGYQSMFEDKSCSSYLGVVIGERLCKHLFKDVEVMPHNNTGYDIVCNRGKKIDVKTGYITLNKGKHPRWKFNIRHNITADFFILIAFDDVENINPLHIWMIPGKEVDNQTNIQISSSTLHKWS